MISSIKSKFFGRGNSIGQSIHLKQLIVLIVMLGIVTFAFAQTSIYKIHIIGDSTVCNYAVNKYPQTGWGQVLSYFFKTGTVTINNAALGGRSSKSFYIDKLWANNVQSVLKSGDFVLIQFGHNDRDYSKEVRYADTTLYKSYLRLYVNESRAKGAIPVFVSPMNMNTWTGTELRRVFTERTRGADYRGAMINVANELKVPFIDLEQKSATYMKSLGQPYCQRFHFLGLVAGEYSNFPDGITDGTHFQEMGALINARMIAEGIKELSSHTDVGKLAAVLAPLYKVTVKANKASTGLVTLSGDFPQGVTVTLKVVPKAGETFQNWADASGSNVTASALYKFTMGSTPVTYNAMFKGGGSVAIDNGNLSSGHLQRGVRSIRIGHKQSDRNIYVTAGSTIKLIELFDLKGNRLLKNDSDSNTATAALGGLSSGMYCIKITLEGSVESRNINLR